MKNLLLTLAILIPSLTFSMSATADCDTLILKNGKKMMVKITSVDSLVVKYERCGESGGKQFSMQREFVWGIVSENPVFHQPVFDGVAEAAAQDKAKQKRKGKLLLKIIVIGVVTIATLFVLGRRFIFIA